MTLWTFTLALACGEGPGDTAGDAPAAALPDDPRTSCVETNEDCAPETCAMGDATRLAGSNCLACHGEDTRAEGTSLFTAGGTVYEDKDGSATVEGAAVRLTDEAGQELELASDENGNFYTSVVLDFPLRNGSARSGGD